MILEGIVTTLSLDGELNIAPMGPRISPDLNMAQFVLSPFRTSTTYHNLKAGGEGVFHVTDDVLLLAQTAIGAPTRQVLATRPADVIAGHILVDACRYYEFRVVELDDREDRTTDRRRNRRARAKPRLFWIQPRQARRGRGSDPGDARGMASARRTSGRVP